jgi:gag-polyprotein putative aspartyl protease
MMMRLRCKFCTVCFLAITSLLGCTNSLVPMAPRGYETSVSLTSEKCRALQAVVEQRERFGIVAPSGAADEEALQRCVLQEAGGRTLPYSGSDTKNWTPNPGPIASPLVPPTGDEIRLTRQGQRYLVPVSVNGLPAIGFVIDTGADTVALPAEIVLTLWRTGTLQSTDFIGDRVYVLADGSKLPSPTFRIRELQVGRQVIHNVEGNLNPALTDPLLGGSFLSRFAEWRIDNQKQLLILSR